MIEIRCEAKEKEEKKPQQEDPNIQLVKAMNERILRMINLHLL